MESSQERIRCGAYQLGIEFRKARLTGVVEDKYGVDHDSVRELAFSRSRESQCHNLVLSMEA